MIFINNLNKTFCENVIFRNLNLHINKGEILGIIGVSGSGKSTLLRCINGLESIDSGDIIIDNKRIIKMKDNELRDFRKNIGMVFQQFSLIERKNVFDNVALPLVCWKYSNDDIISRVENTLEVVGLKHKIYERASNLSGGEKQRVAIARALVLDPKILFCDEATSALDPKTTLDILNLIKKINSNLGITVVMVTHEMDVVKQTCDRVAVLNNQNLDNIGKVDDIFLKKPESLQHILGHTDDNLFSNERNCLNLFFNDNDDSLLSYITQKHNLDYTITKAKKEIYKNKSILHIQIKPSGNNLLETKNILSQYKIDYTEGEI